MFAFAGTNHFPTSLVSQMVYDRGVCSLPYCSQFILMISFISELSSEGVGCHWNHHFVGAVCYADDVALLAPSPTALRLMLKTCNSFADSHSLIFNVNKTQLVKFSRTPQLNTAQFSFCGESLEFSRSVIHLGHILSYDLSDTEDIIAKKKDLCCKANCMVNIFSTCDPTTKTVLFRSFCLSLYGSALWRLSCPALRSLEVTFNNILQKLCRSLAIAILPSFTWWLD